MSQARSLRSPRIATLFILCLPVLVSAVEPLFPPALKPGDTIVFVAPAGPLDEDRIELARKRLEERGFHTRVAEDLYRKTGFLAGTDERRVHELLSAFRDERVNAIFPGTGGYGTTRILDRLDYDLIREHPKVLIGFSDITALHLAIHQQTGLVTFHSPNPMWGLGNEGNLHPFSSRWFWRALLAEKYQDPHGTAAPGYLITTMVGEGTDTDGEFESLCNLPTPVSLHDGKARGRLLGGNLSLIAALMGTPYEIETDGKILFIEDVGEAPYRVDRMLCTLRLAGKLDGLAGAILGSFTRRKNEDTSDEITTIDDVLKEYFGRLKIPVVKGFPVGHHVCNATLPQGVLCELDSARGELRLLENPVLP